MKNLIFLLSFLVSYGAMAQQEQTPMVMVTGTGTVSVVPDKVLIKARIEHTGKSATEVKKENDQVVNEVIKYLRSQGIESKNIQTEYIRLNKDHNYNTKETFYSANQAISIQLNDLGKYETVMSGLLESGLNRVDGVQFGTSQKEELQSQARKKAMENARQKATEYAEALDQTIGKARSISEVQSNNFQPVSRMMEVQADSDGQETIAPGEMEITVKVNVGFMLY